MSIEPALMSRVLRIAFRSTLKALILGAVSYCRRQGKVRRGPERSEDTRSVAGRSPALI